jgi:hypothetical protein
MKKVQKFLMQTDYEREELSFTIVSDGSFIVLALIPNMNWDCNRVMQPMLTNRDDAFISDLINGYFS